MDPIDLIRPLGMMIALLNIGLLLALLVIFIKSYIKIKSKFTLGLMIFATLMFLQKVGNILFFLRYSEFRVPKLGLPVFALSLLELLAYSALLWITWE